MAVAVKPGSWRTARGAAKGDQQSNIHAQCTIQNAQCTIQNEKFTIHNPQCTCARLEYIVQCTMLCAHKQLIGPMYIQYVLVIRNDSFVGRIRIVVGICSYNILERFLCTDTKYHKKILMISSKVWYKTLTASHSRDSFFVCSRKSMIFCLFASVKKKDKEGLSWRQTLNPGGFFICGIRTLTHTNHIHYS